MPVERFRTIEEMGAAPIRVRNNDDSFDRFIRHCARFQRIHPRRYPRGVFRFRTLEEAQAARARVAREGKDQPGSQPGTPR